MPAGKDSWHTRRMQALAPDGMRYCGGCGQYLPRAEFGAKRQCKTCYAVTQRKHRHKQVGEDLTTKYCQYCRQYLPADQFEPKSLHCNACAAIASVPTAERRRQRSAAWREKNRDRTSEYNRTYNASGKRKEQRQAQKERMSQSTPPRPVGRPRKEPQARPAPTPKRELRPRFSSRDVAYACEADRLIAAQWLSSRSHTRHTAHIRMLRLLCGSVAQGVPFAEIRKVHIANLEATQADDEGPLTDTQRQQLRLSARALFAYMMTAGLRTDNPAETREVVYESQRRREVGRQTLVFRDHLKNGELRSGIIDAWDAGTKSADDIAELIKSNQRRPRDTARRELQVVTL